jgi:hypothetical protein
MPSLKSLALASFENLTIAELKLVDAAAAGEFVVCGPNQEYSDPTNCPRNADNWGEERQVRAELIRWICRDPVAKSLVDPKGIQILGAKIIGALDLTELVVPFRLALLRCSAREEISLKAVEISLLAFDGSWVSSIKADGAKVGGITLRNGFRAEQQVRLQRARIRLDLDCGGGTFINPARIDAEEAALSADGATFGGGIFLNRGFHAEGGVRLSRVHLQGDLDCSGGTFHNPRSQAPGSGIALNADGINVAGSVMLRGLQAEGELRMPRAKVGADIDCGGATVRNPFSWGPVGSPSAMNMEGSAVGGNVVLNNKFRAIGYVTLRGAQITGQLDCSGATFENYPPLGALQSMPALDASLSNIESGAFFRAQFRAEGEVRIQAARIGRAFECDHATFCNPARTSTNASGHALTADGIRVAGRLAMGPAFSAEGEVFLIGAQIEGDLDCGGGQFSNPPAAEMPNAGRALSAHRITVEGNAFIRSGFASKGEVSFQGASIKGNLEATSAEFRGELNLEAASIKGALMLSNIANPKGLQLTLINASVGALADEPAGWPKPGNLLLDGFVYERFSGTAPKDFKTRLEWLTHQRPFLPQPYRQVAKVLRDEGENAGSIKVLYEMERQVRGRETRWWRTYFKNPALRRTIGYGYYPSRTFWWLTRLILVGYALYSAGFHNGSVVPTDKEIYATFKISRQIPAHYQRFHAFIYSLENNLPFVKLGQVDRWEADPNPQNFWSLRVSRFTFFSSFAGLLRWFQWFQILSGWVLGTLFIAGVTGITRKD